jgi:CheY-like chemotaxis protein
MTPIAEKLPTTDAPRVLVVDDEPDMIELVHDTLGRNVDCQLTTAGSAAEAQRILESQPVDLLIVDIGLPDGNGADLLADLRKKHPIASAIVITGSPSVEGAVTALRRGAADFLAKPFTVDEFVRRIRAALHRQALIVKSENRIERLREAVRRLNQARRLVTRKVDLLCNDLVNAYGDLSRQFDLVRTTESFRSAITLADDLEQMLCHAMDWMLRQIGYSNVAVWLSGEPGFQLGAYMKYSIAGETGLVEAMRVGILPQVARDGMIHFSAAEAAERLSPEEMKFIANQTILAGHCTYLGESLAAIVLFREGEKPFTEEDVATLRAIGPIFAWTLATMVRQNPDGEDDEDINPFSDGGSIAEHDEDAPPPQQKPRKRKKDDADWWKNGEEPPF